jgi:hypothetical protein
MPLPQRDLFGHERSSLTGRLIQRRIRFENGGRATERGEDPDFATRHWSLRTFGATIGQLLGIYETFYFDFQMIETIVNK